MKITLLRAFRDDYRQSMTYYADQLHQSLLPLIKEGEQMEDFLPKTLFLKPNLARYFSQYILYQNAVSKLQSDLFHITDHSYSHLIHSLQGKKNIVTFHDAIWLKNASSLRRGTVLRWNLSGLQKADWILCDSFASQRALLEHLNFSKEKTSIAYPGVDPLFLNPPEGNPFQILGIKPEIYLLHVGHTGDYKNIPALFYVLAEVRKRGIEAKLLKAGTAFSPEQSAVIKRLGLRHEIVHLGLVKRELLPYIYKASQILLFPSRDEGFGFPVLEAIACGIPVISSNRGSLPELNPKPELQFDPQDYAAMANAAVELLKNAAFRKNVNEAGKIKLENFSWNRTAQKTMEVYRQI